MRLSLLVATLAVPALCAAQPFTHADSLRGGNGPARSWWDVTYYDLDVHVSPSDSSISGVNRITYLVVASGDELQIDLQPPMDLTAVAVDGIDHPVRREGNAWFVGLLAPQAVGSVHTITARFRGRPRVAVNPPWDGGFQWEWDDDGNPWVATSNQGLGASIWWPNKDLQSEEPDSQRIAITVPEPLAAVSNGRLESTEASADGTTTWRWFVRNPINNYSISVNAGRYAHWSEEFAGEAGTLTMDFWPLAVNLDRAREQWVQARSVMACFESWFGPYPFYLDGYKLIEVPYLGMEHQSGVTYGNGFANGYRGRDLSGSGWGLQWDFIIVHETAHEWWGNNITAADIAENWIHEGFGNYSENIYTECLTGRRAAGAEYAIGTRKDIANRRPLIAPYGVNAVPPGDMYPKGGNLLHTLRQLVDDDHTWKEILRGLNTSFRHRIVSTADVEQYIQSESGLALGPVFDQYLRDTRIPVLEWELTGDVLSFRWRDVVPGFSMPVRMIDGSGSARWIHPNERWQTTSLEGLSPDGLGVDPDFYVESRDVSR